MKKRISFKRGLQACSLVLFSTLLVSCTATKNNSAAVADNASKSITAKNGQTLWGSSAAPFPDEKIDRVEAWKRLNEMVKSLNGGYGLEGRRTYERGLPATWSASVMAEDAGLCKASFSSIKPGIRETASGANDEAIKRFVRSIPDNRIVYLVFHHEPEDDLKKAGLQPAVLQEAFARFVDDVLSVNKPNVHPSFVLMSYSFRPQSGRNPDDYNLAAKLKPEQLKQVIAGVDGYSQTPATVSARQIFEPPFAKFASWGFSRFGIFETATKGSADNAHRAQWIRDLGAWVKSRNDIELVSWFHSGVGPHAGPTGWFIGTRGQQGDRYELTDDDRSIATYAQLLKP